MTQAAIFTISASAHQAVDDQSKSGHDLENDNKPVDRWVALMMTGRTHEVKDLALHQKPVVIKGVQFARQKVIGKQAMVQLVDEDSFKPSDRRLCENEAD
jgi:hypothetical protein